MFWVGLKTWNYNSGDGLLNISLPTIRTALGPVMPHMYEKRMLFLWLYIYIYIYIYSCRIRIAEIVLDYCTSFVPNIRSYYECF